MSDAGGEWQFARRRKGPARKSQSLQRGCSASTCCPEEQLDIEKTVKRIREKVSELRCEDFWPKWKEQLLVAASFPQPLENTHTDDSAAQPEKCEDGRACQRLECVCYGLGSFSSCPSSRYQLAMLLLLLDAGQIPPKDCSVYDPVFSIGEKDILMNLGLNVLTENEEGKRLAARPTLFYLMHCGKALYNNLLWKNWSTKHLPLVMIIGNSFRGMKDRTIDREFERDYGYINQALDVCEERRLPCPSRFIDVFSDSALLTFPMSNLEKLPQSSWSEPHEPQYQHCGDLEIILRETHR